MTPPKPSLVIHPWPLAGAARVAAAAAPILPELQEARVWLLAEDGTQLPGAETLNASQLAAARAEDPAILDEALYFFCPPGLAFDDFGRMRVILFHEQLAIVGGSRFAAGARWQTSRLRKIAGRLGRKTIGEWGDANFGALLLAPGLITQAATPDPRVVAELVRTNDWPMEEVGVNVSSG